MDVKTYFIWPKFSYLTLVKDNPKKAIIFAPEEFEITPNWSEREHFDKLHNIDLTIIFGSSNLDFYKSKDIPRNTKVEIWPTYWLSRTYEILNEKRITINQESHINKIFVSLNNKAHDHRCMLIDELYKEEMFDYGNITFHEPHINSQYKWKYWLNRRRLILDSKYSKTLDSWGSFPEEFSTSLIDLVAESTMKTIFITEKTYRSILLSKIFLVFGAPLFHKTLEDMGFQLYTEIFDYSFDSEPVIEKRLEGLIKNLKKLIGKDPNKINKMLSTKIEFNKQHALNVINSKKFLPPTLVKYLDELNKSTLMNRNIEGYLKLKNYTNS